MKKLDKIEARVKREVGLGATEWLGPSATAVELEDVALLVRAVRQLGVERQEYQKLFDAVDDLGSDRPTSLQTAFDDICSANEPNPDVLDLIAPQEGREG